MLGRAAGSISSGIKARPYSSTVLFASCRGCVADYAAQKIEQKQDPTLPQRIDRNRMMVYTLFSNFVSFTIDRPVYAILLPRLFPTYVAGKFSKLNVFKATCFDNFLVTPVYFFPCFYIFKDALVEQTHTVRGALEHYASEFWTQNAVNCACWFPIHTVTFSIPPHLRVGFTAAAATAYVTVLSYTTAWLDRLSATAATPAHHGTAMTPSLSEREGSTSRRSGDASPLAATLLHASTAAAAADDVPR